MNTSQRCKFGFRHRRVLHEEPAGSVSGSVPLQSQILSPIEKRGSDGISRPFYSDFSIVGAPKIDPHSIGNTALSHGARAATMLCYSLITVCSGQSMATVDHACRPCQNR